jgi:hypothetical protein
VDTDVKANQNNNLKYDTLVKGNNDPNRLDPNKLKNIDESSQNSQNNSKLEYFTE